MTIMTDSMADRPVGTERLDLTILMPCLNEAETLDACIHKALGFIDRAGLRGEVLVADNGSTDGSQAIAHSAGARVVEVTQQGYGAAVLGGIAAAEGRYIIMGDADDSYDFENLEGFFEKLDQGYDLVMGNRFRGGIQPSAMPFLHRYLGNPVLSFLGRLFYGIPIGDFHCGLRGFSRDAIRRLELQAPGMEFASEMIVKASLDGLTITEVPTTLAPDGRSRPPHLKSWTDGWRHLRFLLLHSPRWLFYYPGLTMIGGGALLAALVVGGNLEIAPGVEIGIHTLITACFAVVIGVQLVAFSVLARRRIGGRGILPRHRYDDMFALFNLERILKVALVLFVAGIIGFGSAVGYWVSIGFGAIHLEWVQIVVVTSLTAVTVALQLAFTGFFASVFELEKR